jgi:hypothetical protein
VDLRDLRGPAANESFPAANPQTPEATAQSSEEEQVE